MTRRSMLSGIKNHIKKMATEEAIQEATRALKSLATDLPKQDYRVFQHPKRRKGPSPTTRGTTAPSTLDDHSGKQSGKQRMKTESHPPSDASTGRRRPSQYRGSRSRERLSDSTDTLGRMTIG